MCDPQPARLTGHANDISEPLASGRRISVVSAYDVGDVVEFESWPGHVPQVGTVHSFAVEIRHRSPEESRLVYNVVTGDDPYQRWHPKARILRLIERAKKEVSDA